MSKPAILGGRPAFPDGLPFSRPARPPLERVVQRLEPSYALGRLTNGPLVSELEEAAAARIGLPHVVAVSSCTSGLMLVVQAIAPPGSRVVMPSFTFSASAHAARWAGTVPSFVEVDGDDYQASLPDLESHVAGAGAVMAVHMCGAPCHPDAVVAAATEAGVPVLFDAAHAFGASSGGRAVGGFGVAEVFSLSPTKVLVAGEGGLVTTSDEALAQRLRHGRDYGNSGDYDPAFAGLNARMSELHAAVALESLAMLDDHLARRAELASRYRRQLADVPGIGLQRIADGDTTTNKLFSVVVDEATFGASRDAVVAGLAAEGIDTRQYFSPPVHQQKAYAPALRRLPVTDRLAASVISLPLWRDLDDDSVDRVVHALIGLQARASDLPSQPVEVDLRGATVPASRGTACVPW